MGATADTRAATRASIAPRRRYWIVGHGADRGAFTSAESALQYIAETSWQRERMTLTSRVVETRGAHPVAEQLWG